MIRHTSNPLGVEPSIPGNVKFDVSGEVLFDGGILDRPVGFVKVGPKTKSPLIYQSDRHEY